MIALLYECVASKNGVRSLAKVRHSKSWGDGAVAIRVRVVHILLRAQSCGSSWVTLREKNMGTIEAPPQWKGDDHMEELLRETPESEAYWRSSEAARDDKIQFGRNRRSKEG